MDFYHIGAMKVFSQLGQLIEDDERNQIKLSDLPIDIMQKIGSYLLQDPNKTVHKTLKNRTDDDLQVLLFGEVKDLLLYDEENRIGHYSHILKEYIKYILHVKGITTMLETMEVNFYDTCSSIIIKIKMRNKKKEVLAVIETVNSYGKIKHLLKYKLKNEWMEQNIMKKDIIDEYESIREQVINKYF